MRYRRSTTPGATYFFTVVTYRRRAFLREPDSVALSLSFLGKAVWVVFRASDEGSKIAGMKLPNGERADLGGKLEDYVLNPLHREGKHKAHVFASLLGITLTNVQVLRKALLDAAASSEQVEPRGDNGFGEVYVLRFPLDTAKGTATVLSVWIIRHGEDFPRLTTCYIV